MNVVIEISEKCSNEHTLGDTTQTIPCVAMDQSPIYHISSIVNDFTFLYCCYYEFGSFIWNGFEVDGRHNVIATPIASDPFQMNEPNLYLFINELLFISFIPV